MKNLRILILAGVLALPLTSLFAQQSITDPAWKGDIDQIMSLRERTEAYNKNLGWKLENVLPQIMEEEDMDMWVIINFELDNDPIYPTMVARPGNYARRLSILIFHRTDEGVRKLTSTWHGSGTAGPWYESIFTSAQRAQGAEGQFVALANYIEEAKPRKIAINYDTSVLDDFSHANGLSAYHYHLLQKHLSPEYQSRLVSAKNLCIRWYETRTPWEMEYYVHLCGIAHELIREFYSNAVITPGVTTRHDVRWWICERIQELKLDYWFFPSLDIIRGPENRAKYGNEEVIYPGDLLHCDVGISHMGLSTDMQHNAYVLREGETEPPQGLQKLYQKGLRLQEIYMGELKAGRSGNEILASVLSKGKAEGLNPVVYSHPVNYYGHASGMTVGMTDKQGGMPGTGDHPLHQHTTYAMEFSIAGEVPEWGDQMVRLGFEENILFTDDKARLIDGYPTKMYLINANK